MDPLFPIQPVQPVRDSISGKKRMAAVEKKPTDSKIKGYVLEKIGEEQVTSRGALLPSTAAPRVMIDLLSALAIPAIGDERMAPFIEPLSFSRKRRRLSSKRAIGKMIPVGLRRCKPYEWINAWIQFLLFLPSVPELFSFVPRKFEVFREFAEQYTSDQLENKEVSLANSASLVRGLLQKLPAHLFRNPLKMDLYELLRFFAESGFPYFSTFCKSVLFHSKWHLIWDANGEERFEEAFWRKAKSFPPEILVAIQEWKDGLCFFLKKQFFLSSSGICYDLDAFIEDRGGAYIAYLKVEGTWYQCDDERVTPLLSTTLNASLHRAVLLHYKKIRPAF